MSKIKPETVEEIRYLHEQGLSDVEIALKIGCSRETVNNYRNNRDRRKSYAPPKPKPIPKLDEIITEAEELDYSKLPSDILFNPKNFPSF